MGKIRFSIFLVLMLFSSVSIAQVNQYMVFFQDKAGTPYSVSNPSAYLSSKAIQRRAIQNISIDEKDLPVNPSYVLDVKNTGASVIYKTKWMNGILVSCDASLLPAINALPQVTAVKYVSPGAHPSAGGRQKSIKDKKDTKQAVTDNQLSMLGIDEMHADGHRGEDITIAVFDGGFSGANLTAPFAHIFSENRFDAVASYDFVHGGHEVFQYDDHGTRVWSIIAAFVDGLFIGGAYKANFQLYVTEDVPTEYRVEEYNWLFAAERADSAGVDIINSSLGYNFFDDASMDYSTSQMDGETAVITRAAQLAADKGMLVVTSAGNEGLDASWRIITAPADAKDVLAIGSVNSFMVRSPTSSIGPTADGRIKPDVVALGSGTSIVRENGSTNTTGSGTSFSAPLVTGLAAGLWQRQPGLSNKALMEAIRMSASMAPNPDNFFGYGLPNYTAAKHFIEQVEQDEMFAVFPNPITHDTLTIRPKNPEALPPVVILLVSSQGQIIREQEVKFTWLDNQYTADLSSLSAGMYLIRIQAGQQVFVYKIVKI